MEEATTTNNASNTTTAATSLEDNEQQFVMFDNNQRQHQGEKVTIANKQQSISMPIPVTSATVSTTTTAAASLNSPLSPRMLSVFCWDKIDEKDDINAHVAMLRKSSQTTANIEVTSEKLGSIESNEDYNIGHVGLSIDTMNSSILQDSPKNAARKRNGEMTHGTFDESGKTISMVSIVESPRLTPRAGEELLIFGDLEL